MANGYSANWTVPRSGLLKVEQATGSQMGGSTERKSAPCTLNASPDTLQDLTATAKTREKARCAGNLQWRHHAARAVAVETGLTDTLYERAEISSAPAWQITALART